MPTRENVEFLLPAALRQTIIAQSASNAPAEGLVVPFPGVQMVWDMGHYIDPVSADTVALRPGSTGTVQGLPLWTNIGDGGLGTQTNPLFVANTGPVGGSSVLAIDRTVVQSFNFSSNIASGSTFGVKASFDMPVDGYLLPSETFVRISPGEIDQAATQVKSASSFAYLAMGVSLHGGTVGTVPCGVFLVGNLPSSLPETYGGLAPLIGSEKVLFGGVVSADQSAPGGAGIWLPARKGYMSPVRVASGVSIDLALGMTNESGTSWDTRTNTFGFDIVLPVATLTGPSPTPPTSPPAPPPPEKRKRPRKARRKR